MNAGAVECIAVFERAAMGMQAAVTRKQGRVNVEHSPAVSLNQLRIEDAHEAGENHQVGVKGTDAFGDHAIEIVPVRKVGSAYYSGRDAGLLCAYQAVGSGYIADDSAYCDCRQFIAA